MKNNQLTLILVIVFFLTTVAAGGLIFMYNNGFHKLQEAQGRGNNAVNLRTVFQQLISESIEYSKRNHAIDPVLAPVTNRAAANAGSTTGAGNK